jgi:hypothetical protein
MRRLLAVAATAAALAAPLTPIAASAAECGGVLDYECTGWVCPTDCWYRECLVWVDPLHDEVLAQCVRDPLA